MVQTRFDHVRHNTNAGHAGCHGPPQIVQPPRCDRPFSFVACANISASRRVLYLLKPEIGVVPLVLKT